MAETSEHKWRNPLSVWGGKRDGGEFPTRPWRSHQEVWRKARKSKAKLFPVGRLRYWCTSRRVTVGPHGSVCDTGQHDAGF